MHEIRVLTMDNLQNKGDICVVSSGVGNEKSDSPLCNSSVVPIRSTGKFSQTTLPKLHHDTVLSQVKWTVLVKDEETGTR